MPTLNYENVGALVEYDYLQGTVTALYPEDDTADVTLKYKVVVIPAVPATETSPAVEEVTEDKEEELTGIPIFYHCENDSVIRDNGAIEGAASGFSVDDVTIVLVGINSVDSLGEKYYIIGHYDGVRKCSGGSLLEICAPGGVDWRYWDIKKEEFIDITGNDGTIKKVWGTKAEFSDWAQKIRRRIPGAATSQFKKTIDGKDYWYLNVRTGVLKTEPNPFLSVNTSWFVVPDASASTAGLYLREYGYLPSLDTFEEIMLYNNLYIPYSMQYWQKVTGAPSSFGTYYSSYGPVWTAIVPVEEPFPGTGYFPLWISPYVPLYTRSKKVTAGETGINEHIDTINELWYPGVTDAGPDPPPGWYTCELTRVVSSHNIRQRNEYSIKDTDYFVWYNQITSEYTATLDFYDSEEIPPPLNSAGEYRYSVIRNVPTRFEQVAINSRTIKESKNNSPLILDMTKYRLNSDLRLGDILYEFNSYAEARSPRVERGGCGCDAFGWTMYSRQWVGGGTRTRTFIDSEVSTPFGILQPEQSQTDVVYASENLYGRTPTFPPLPDITFIPHNSRIFGFFTNTEIVNFAQSVGQSVEHGSYVLLSVGQSEVRDPLGVNPVSIKHQPMLSDSNIVKYSSTIDLVLRGS